MMMVHNLRCPIVGLGFFCHLRNDFLKRFHFCNPLCAKPLKISGQRIHQWSFITVQLCQRFGIGSGFWIILDDALNGLIECDQ